MSGPRPGPGYYIRRDDWSERDLEVATAASVQLARLQKFGTRDEVTADAVIVAHIGEGSTRYAKFATLARSMADDILQTDEKGNDRVPTSPAVEGKRDDKTRDKLGKKREAVRRELLERKKSIRVLAKEYGVSISTIKRERAKLREEDRKE